MPEQDDPQPRWYDANSDELDEFFAALLKLFQNSYSNGIRFEARKRHLTDLIDKHGGAWDGRETWLHIRVVIQNQDVIECKQRQPGERYNLFSLTPAETLEVANWPPDQPS